jgi:hypothetical protein
VATATASVNVQDTVPPVITGPTGGPGAPTADASIPENTTAVATLTASEPVSWSLSGADAALFEIDAGGHLRFVNAPDYEHPLGAGDNSYAVTVKARDGAGLTTTQMLHVAVTNVDEFAPVITDSNGAADTVATTARQGAATGITVSASDADAGTSITYRLVDSAGGLFAIDPTTGVVTVADAAQLQADGVAAHTITVEAISSDGSVQTAKFTIEVEQPQAVPVRIDDGAPLPVQPDPHFAYGGRDFPLAISPFRVPEPSGEGFKSLAQGEFAQRGDSALRENLHFLSTAFRNLLTQPGEHAFRIVVRMAPEASLRLFRGIPDQEFLQTRAVRVQVPADAFIHTQPDATVYLSARLADGRPLPRWLQFDASTGKFSGTAPASAPSMLSVLVEAHDRDGRHAEAIFRIRLEKAPAGRPGLSQQLRSAQAGDIDALRSLQAPVRQPVVHQGQ